MSFDTKKLALTQRGRIRVLCFVTAGLLILGGFTAMGWKKAADLRRFIEYTYQRSFIELVTSLEAVDTTLQKGLYASSPVMMSQLSGDISRRAAAAQAVLGQLPFSFEELEQTSTFLSRVSDYSAVMSRKAASGAALDEEEINNLKALSAAAHKLAIELGDLQAIINEQNLRIGAVASAEGQIEDKNGRAYFEDAFRNMENNFQDLPSLIYDGPFSEHLDQRKADLLAAEQEINSEQALERAIELLGLSKGQLELARESEGLVPSYVFAGHVNGGELSVEITKAGGYVISVMSSRSQKNAELSVTEAIEKAQSFLKTCGYEGMAPSYWMDTGSVLLINFAYEQNGVLCYPDLIVVGIARDTGEVIQMEARGYIMNHSESREFTAPAISLDEAKEALTPDLTLYNTRECIIPSSGEYELHCYELTCTTEDGVHVLLYINAATGVEEKILILIEDENGVLAV